MRNVTGHAPRLDPQELCDILVAAVEEAGRRVEELLRSEARGEEVGVGAAGDRTLRLDLEAEKELLGELRRELDGFSAVSEELGVVGKGYPLIIIDPVDGSYNAARRVPFYAISVAAAYGERHEDVVAGVVYAPALEEVYTATKGGGAYLNGLRLRVRARAPGEPVVSVAAPKLAGEKPGRVITRLLHAGFKVRVLGSASLEICFVASGRLDAYLAPWPVLRFFDVAAALLIAREAGAYADLTEASLRDLGARISVLVSASPHLLKEVKELMEHKSRYAGRD